MASRLVLPERYSHDEDDGSDLPKHVTPPPANGKPFVSHIDTFVSQFNTFSSKLYVNPDEAYRNSRTQQTAMRRDPVIMQPLRQRQLATALLEWQITPEDQDDPVQQLVCDELTNIIKATPHFLKFRMALLEAVWFGRYAVNVMYEWGDAACLTMRPCRWRPIHGDKLTFEFETGNVGVMVGRPTTPGGDVRFGYESRVRMLSQEERKALVLHTHEIEDGEFFDSYSAGSIHGVGLRTRVYWPWWLKQTSFQWLMDHMQRVGTGFTLWFYEHGNKEDERKTREAAENFTNENVILVPMPIGQERPFERVKRIEPGGGGAELFKSIIDDYLGQQIRGMIVGQQLTSEAAPTGMGSNVAKVHQDTFLQIVEFDAQNLGETITTDYVKVLARYNFKGIDWTPKFDLVLQEQDPKAMLEAAQAFAQMGGRIGENQLREIIGLAPPDQSDRILGQSAPVPQEDDILFGKGEPHLPTSEMDMGGAPGMPVYRSGPRGGRYWIDARGQKHYGLPKAGTPVGLPDGWHDAETVMRTHGGGVEFARSGWDESKHPRGQPGNAGEFSSISGGYSLESSGKRFKQRSLFGHPDPVEEMAVAPHPVENKEAARQAAREDYQKNGTKAKAFRAWFGNSKVVDDKGEPLRVYHGTKKQFTEFTVGSAEGQGPGIYFSTNKEDVGEFAHGGRVVEAYLSIQKPFMSGASEIPSEASSTMAWKTFADRYAQKYDSDPDIEDAAFGSEGDMDLRNKILQELGYDGIMAKGANSLSGTEILVFRPNQIKAVDNEGTFDPSTNDILYSRDGEPVQYGKWRSIGKGQHGAKVYIENGVITKGCPELQGEDVENIDHADLGGGSTEEAGIHEGASDAEKKRAARKQKTKEEFANRGKRKQDNDAAAYAHAKRRQEARKLGLDPNAVEQAFNWLREQEGQHIESHNDLLSTAKRSIGVDLRNRAFRTGGDTETINKSGKAKRGFDDVAQELSNSAQYAQHFVGVDDPGGHLFNIIAAGELEPRADDELWQEAMGVAMEHRQMQPSEDDEWGTPAAKTLYGDAVPFSREWVLDRYARKFDPNQMSFDFDESKHPRDEKGRWTAGQHIEHLAKVGNDLWKRREEKGHKHGDEFRQHVADFKASLPSIPELQGDERAQKAIAGHLDRMHKRADHYFNEDAPHDVNTDLDEVEELLGKVGRKREVESMRQQAASFKPNVKKTVDAIKQTYGFRSTTDASYQVKIAMDELKRATLWDQDDFDDFLADQVGTIANDLGRDYEGEMEGKLDRAIVNLHEDAEDAKGHQQLWKTLTKRLNKLGLLNEQTKRVILKQKQAAQQMKDPPLLKDEDGEYWGDYSASDEEEMDRLREQEDAVMTELYDVAMEQVGEIRKGIEHQFRQGFLDAMGRKDLLYGATKNEPAYEPPKEPPVTDLEKEYVSKFLAGDMTDEEMASYRERIGQQRQSNMQQYARRRYAEGQQSFQWDESKVARDDDGKFAEKGEGHKSFTLNFHPDHGAALDLIQKARRNGWGVEQIEQDIVRNGGEENLVHGYERLLNQLAKKHGKALDERAAKGEEDLPDEGDLALAELESKHGMSQRAIAEEIHRHAKMDKQTLKQAIGEAHVQQRRRREKPAVKEQPKEPKGDSRVSMMAANKIVPPDFVTDSEKAKRIGEEMKEAGKWIGRPLLATERNGRIHSWTGTHRLAATGWAEIDEVPVVLMDAAAIASAAKEMGLPQNFHPGDLYDKQKKELISRINNPEALQLIEEEIAQAGKRPKGKEPKAEKDSGEPQKDDVIRPPKGFEVAKSHVLEGTKIDQANHPGNMAIVKDKAGNLWVVRQSRHNWTEVVPLRNGAMGSRDESVVFAPTDSQADGESRRKETLFHTGMKLHSIEEAKKQQFKQTHEYTKKEWVGEARGDEAKRALAEHRSAVESALSKGEDVSESVLADYPGLKPSAGTDLTDAILAAEPAAKDGEPVMLADVRKAAGLTKETFDAVMTKLAESGKVTLLQNDSPRLTDKQKEDMIQLPNGNWYHGVAFRQSAMDEMGASQPTGKQPWEMTLDEYTHSKGAPKPGIGINLEVSGHQRSKMSGRAIAENRNANMQARREASAKHKAAADEWEKSVWEAYKSGEFTLNDVFDTDAGQVVTAKLGEEGIDIESPFKVFQRNNRSEKDRTEYLNQVDSLARAKFVQPKDNEARKSSKEHLVGGKADKMPDQSFNKESLAKGATVEREHTSDPAKAKEIAKDHLAESSTYYEDLEKMEAGSKAKHMETLFGKDAATVISSATLAKQNRKGPVASFADEEFSLSGKADRTVHRPENLGKGRQSHLFAGTDWKPGQQDLFNPEAYSRQSTFELLFGVSPLLYSKGQWDESKHPRGQPENRGEFVKGDQSDSWKSAPLTLYRAGDDSILTGATSFSPDRDIAKAYLSNPGFGGRTLFRTQVEINPEYLLDIRSDDDEAQINAILRAAGLEDRSYGNVTADWLLAQEDVIDSLKASGYEWVRLTDTFPVGADTFTWLYGDNEPELEEDEDD